MGWQNPVKSMKEIIPAGTNRVQIQPRQGLGIGSERNKKKLFAKYLDQNIRCCRKRWQNGIKNLCVWLDWPSIIYLSFNKSISDSKLKGGNAAKKQTGFKKTKKFMQFHLHVSFGCCINCCPKEVLFFLLFFSSNLSS